MSNINYILQNLKNGKLSNAELNCLAKYCVKISLEFLIKKINQYGLKFRNDGVGLNEIAIEAVTLLFTIAKNGKLQIENSLSNWQKPIEDEATASYFLHKVVWSRTEQHLFHLLKESDPIFHRLYKSIMNKAKELGYSKVNIFGTTYLTEKDSSVSLNRISIDDFEKIPDSYFLVDRDQLLQNIFNFLKDETEYQAAIPLNALVRKLKTLTIYEYNCSARHIELSEFEMDIENIISSSMKAAEEKLCHYQKLNRLNLEEVERFKKVLSDLAFDFKNGGLAYRMIYYLKDHFTELDEEQLNKKYYSILDYLIRVMKKEIIKEYAK